jgi:predicted naringenin-chalcone synthase
MAHGLNLQSGEDVTVVHTEMCSLHMNPACHDPEQIVMQTLFADGHMKYQVGVLPAQAVGLEIVRIKELVVPDSGLDMTWVPASWGMRMSLSRDVPSKLKMVVRDFYGALIQECGLDPDVLLRSAHFAVHPGGPKIIDAVQEELELSDEQLLASRKILRERGNMSSVTLPHVWEELLVNPTHGKYVVSLAFGPGLTIFGAVFKMRQW